MAFEASPSDQDSVPSGGPGRYRDLHRRSYEVELLISGAVLFAMLRVPSQVDLWYRRLDPLLAGSAGQAAYFLYYYLKLTLYTLVSALMVHLAVRAYWVGLIGLSSVFPRGIRWDKAKVGPFQRALLGEKAPSLRTMMRGADALASTVFSAAFSLVWIFIISVVYFAAIGGVALLGSALLLGGRGAWWIGVTLGVVLFVVTQGSGLVDRWWGERIEPEGRVGRLLRRGLAFSYYALFQVFYAPVVNILLSNVRRGVVLGVLWGGLMSMGAVFFVKDMLIPLDALRIGAGGAIPDVAGAYGLQDPYYDARRDPPWSSPRAPSIPSEIVPGPFVRLFIPYHPRRDPELMEAACPGLEPLAPTGVRLIGRREQAPDSAGLTRTLACMGRLWTVTLDGRVLDPVYRFSQRAGTSFPGVVTFLPTDGIAGGEHVLVLEKRRSQESEEEDEPPLRHHIPFWH